MAFSIKVSNYHVITLSQCTNLESELKSRIIKKKDGCVIKIKMKLVKIQFDPR